MSKNAHVDTPEIVNPHDRVYPVLQTPTEQGILFSIYIYDDIREPYYFTEAMQAIYEAPPGSHIDLLINSNGGYLDSALALCNSLQDTQATTRAIVQGTAASAATMIALACDTVMFEKGSTFMIHNMSYGTAGKAHEIDAHVRYNTKLGKKTMRDTYANFLTPDEIDKVILGKDKWLTAEKATKRFAKVLEHRVNVEKKAAEDAEEAQVAAYIEALEAKGYKVKKSVA